MKVIVFGATGMVGQGVLRECLKDPAIDKVLAVVRSTTGKSDPKLTELIHSDFTDFTPVESQLTGYDACYFCLGVSSFRMKEAAYRRVTYDFTLAAAKSLAKVSQNMTFIYVSGEGTDTSAQGSSMWARVKGETENALLKLPFKQAFMFRPGMIEAGEGITSKTPMYSVLYKVMSPLIPVMRAVMPNMITSTEKVGLAMIEVTRHGYPSAIVPTKMINQIVASMPAAKATAAA